jgi:hypothetical protein
VCVGSSFDSLSTTTTKTTSLPFFITLLTHISREARGELFGAAMCANTVRALFKRQKEMKRPFCPVLNNKKKKASLGVSKSQKKRLFFCLFYSSLNLINGKTGPCFFCTPFIFFRMNIAYILCEVCIAKNWLKNPLSLAVCVQIMYQTPFWPQNVKIVLAHTVIMVSCMVGKDRV